VRALLRAMHATAPPGVLIDGAESVFTQLARHTHVLEMTGRLHERTSIDFDAFARALRGGALVLDEPVSQVGGAGARF
jgi:hypothetical protein